MRVGRDSLGIFLLSLEWATMVGGLATSRICSGCNLCTAKACRRRLGLLEYLQHTEQAISATHMHAPEQESDPRRLQAEAPALNIPCLVANQYCPEPYSNYCCTYQIYGDLSCGLGSKWGTCSPDGGVTTSASRCDLVFSCPAGQCCGTGTDVFTPGWCGTTSKLCENLLVACNVLGPTDSSNTKTVVLSGVTKIQDNSKWCGLDKNDIGNRGNGRCKSPTNCCSASGSCNTSVENCKTSSKSWVWIGGGNGVSSAWVRETYSAASTYCGFGVIGNGVCQEATAAATFGTVCCSVNGYCGTSGTDVHGQQYCGGDTYDCLNCNNGVKSIGSSPDCETCYSCNTGFGFSTTGNCIAPTVFACPESSEYINEIKLRSSAYINAITSIECSSGTVIPVNVGVAEYLDISGISSSAVGFCGTSSGLFSGYVTQLSFQRCETNQHDAPYGYLGTASTTSLCAGGQRATGIKLALGAATSSIYFLTYFDFICAPVPVSSCPICENGGACRSPATSCTCVDGFDGDTCAQSIALCQRGNFITQITLRSGTGTNAVSSVVCSDGSLLPLSAGGTVGKVGLATSSTGYCAASNGFDYTSVSYVKFTECGTQEIDGPYGSKLFPSGITSTSCNTGEKIVGLRTATKPQYDYITYFEVICATITTAPSTVSCGSGMYITRIDLFADSSVNGIRAITCSNSVTTQVTSGLTGTAYTAISGDGSSVSPGYCSYTSGSSSNYVTQLKFTECGGTVDGTYGSNAATVTAHDCSVGKRATGIKFAPPTTSLTSFAFVCGTITKKVSCASGFYITKIVLRASDVVCGISSFRCSDGTTQQISNGLTKGTSVTALSDDGSNHSVGYCAYSSGLSGSFVTQLKFIECTTTVTDGPFGSNSASVTPVSVSCTSGKRATGITTVTGTAVTSFAFICSTITAATVTAATTVKPTSTTARISSQTEDPTPAPTESSTLVPTQLSISAAAPSTTIMPSKAVATIGPTAKTSTLVPTADAPTENPAPSSNGGT